MSIADSIHRIESTLPQGVRMVAVSKFHPIEELLEAYSAGQRLFGESRQQELLQKVPLMPADTRWHFIGHLQTNKVRQIIGKVAMIESVDSERLLAVIDSESEKAGVVTNVLMQVHVAMEETKFGFYPDELDRFFAQGGYRKYPSVRICGVMGMASNTDDMTRVDADFRAIAACLDRARALAPDLSLDVLSMGMSHDYRQAIAAGANLVRIGTAIFGPREY